MPTVPAYARLPVAAFHEWTASGVFARHERVELIDGRLVEEAGPRSPRDSSARQRLLKRFDRLPPAGWLYWFGRAVTLVESDSEPVPDGLVVRGPAGRYETRHPGPADTAQVIEVAEQTVRSDREVRGRLYAGAGVPAYWIVNVSDRRIEVYTDPDPAATPPAYRTLAVHHPGDVVPVTLAGLAVGTVAVADVVP